MIVINIKTFTTILVSLVFKGELQEVTTKLTTQNQDLVNQLEKEKSMSGYIRELSEYRVQLAARDGKVPDAIIHNKDWNDANEDLKTPENHVIDTTDTLTENLPKIDPEILKAKLESDKK